MGVFKKLYLYLIRCDVDGVMVVMRSIDLIFDIIDCPDHLLLLENSLENVFDCSSRYRYVGSGWVDGGIRKGAPNTRRCN